ncbi:hypothetical protein Pla163_17610 [Planctomycetes bacterium Pla163]|uniref:HEAT repeat protein n=1 Tax=Rohdeia mirabilis TaxID=2528008 RepID=A0A518CZJ0_9BACT|nr:hypothetical protein Pla163_17610 [Planctomycetes bacterium Pla163]
MYHLTATLLHGLLSAVVATSGSYAARESGGAEPGPVIGAAETVRMADAQEDGAAAAESRAASAPVAAQKRARAALLSGVPRADRRAEIREASVAPLSAERAADPDERVRRVGTPVPPGLTAARTKDRRTARAAALEQLAQEWQGLDGPDLIQVLDSLLIDVGTSDETWAAAAAMAGDLRITRLAPRLAAALDIAPTSDIARRVAAARRALHGLYGVWFEGSEEVLPLATLVEGPALATYRAQLLGLEERLLAQLTRLWVHQPDAAVLALVDLSPRVRVAAARSVAASVSSGTLDAAVAADALLAAADAEIDSDALCAQLEALSPLLQVRSADDPRVERGRAIIARGASEAPISVQHCLARLAAALPWQVGGDVPPASTARAAFELTQTALERVAASQPIDADVLIGVLQSQRSLSHSFAEQAVGLEPALSTAILSLFDRPEATREVRLAAASALVDLASVDDLASLVARCDQAQDFAVRFALSGAIAGLVPRIGLATPGARDLLQLLPKLVAAPEEQLRVRALAILDGLTADVTPAQLAELDLDIAYLIDSWPLETGVASRETLERLIRRLGRPQDLESMLQRDTFATAAARGPRQAASVVTVLASSNPGLLLRSARVLANIDDPEQLESALVEALQLGVGIDLDDAPTTGPPAPGTSPGANGAGVEPNSGTDAPGDAGADDGTGASSAEAELLAAQSAEFVGWALQLRALTGTLGSRGRPSGPDGSAPRPVLVPRILDALVRIHVPRAGLSAWERARAAALFAFDAGRAPDVVDRAFVEALDRAPAEDTDASVFGLRAERARFLVEAQRQPEALALYRELFREAGPSELTALGRRGLREYERLARAEPSDGTAAERARILLALVALDSWATLDRARRVEELFELLNAVNDAHVKPYAVRALELTEASGLTDPAQWEGIEGGGQVLEDLGELLSGVANAAEFGGAPPSDGGGAEEAAAPRATDASAPVGEAPVGDPDPAEETPSADDGAAGEGTGADGTGADGTGAGRPTPPGSGS